MLPRRVCISKKFPFLSQLNANKSQVTVEYIDIPEDLKKLLNNFVEKYNLYLTYFYDMDIFSGSKQNAYIQKAIILKAQLDVETSATDLEDMRQNQIASVGYNAQLGEWKELIFSEQNAISKELTNIILDYNNSIKKKFTPA